MAEGSGEPPIRKCSPTPDSGLVLPPLPLVPAGFTLLAMGIPDQALALIERLGRDRDAHHGARERELYGLRIDGIRGIGIVKEAPNG